jgi:hypothetical protein
MPRVSPVAAKILPVDVKVMQVFVAPREEELEHPMELCQGGVAADQESSPDERADAAQDDAQLIDVRVCSGLVHGQSVQRSVCRFKGSPRYLAVST